MHLTELQAHSKPLYDWQRRVVWAIGRRREGRGEEEEVEEVEDVVEVEKHCSPQDEERSLKAGTS